MIIRRLIPKSLRKALSPLILPKSPVLWANWGKISHILANHYSLKFPPVVILSMPRSGSSWVGEIMGKSENSLYMREPITQTYLKNQQTGPSFFEFNEANMPPTYQTSADNVFSGLPVFGTNIITQAYQWALTKRKNRRIVIKEVNPFMVHWLIKHFEPRIIYLIRHPVAVANSFNRLGYNGKQIESRFSEETLKKYQNYSKYTHSFWSDHGAMQAIILNEILEQTQEYKSFRLVQYENLCENPMLVFKELYDFAELPWNDAIEQLIIKRTNPESINKDNFSTERNSNYEMTKWKHEVSEDAIKQVKEAFLSFNPQYYRDNW